MKLDYYSVIVNTYPTYEVDDYDYGVFTIFHF